MTALSWGVSAQALEVFACEPEWAALVRSLAPAAKITTATHALQDPHHIEARPALISALRRADLAVCSGAELEAGWLPMLQQRAGNPRVRDGAPGMFYAAHAVTLLNPQQRNSFSVLAGDVHPDGNPHFHLDPQRLAQVAAALAQRLSLIDPAQAAQYQAAHQAWSRDWQARVQAWQLRAAPLKGQRVVAQHTALAYSWDWLGVVQVADLEPKPGLPPSPGHLQQVLRQVRQAPPLAVVQAVYQDPQAGRWLTQQLAPSQVALLSLPTTVTEDGPASTLPGLYEHLLNQLLGALK